MPRLESTELQRLEKEGAAEAVSTTVNEMADAYVAYVQSLKEQVGSGVRVPRGMRQRVVEDLRKRFSTTE